MPRIAGQGRRDKSNTGSPARAPHPSIVALARERGDLCRVVQHHRHDWAVVVAENVEAHRLQAAAEIVAVRTADASTHSRTASNGAIVEEGWRPVLSNGEPSGPGKHATARHLDGREKTEKIGQVPAPLPPFVGTCTGAGSTVSICTAKAGREERGGRASAGWPVGRFQAPVFAQRLEFPRANVATVHALEDLRLLPAASRQQEGARACGRAGCCAASLLR
jgi:hypothetical protein